MSLHNEQLQPMLKLTRHDYDSLRQHGEETYPHECCGILLGRVDGDGTRIVTSIARAGNTRIDSPHNRYNIDPRDQIRIQREAENAARTSSAITTPTPTTLRAGQQLTWLRPIGPESPM